MFVHDDGDFDALLQIVAGRERLGIGLVEKDYWVTHTLWALHAQGFEVWFKGGTSLSKGFGLIQRFSEDLDLKIEPGGVTALSAVTNWKSEGKKAVAERRGYFETLARTLSVPGATVIPSPVQDQSLRSANLQVDYPGRHLALLSAIMQPFVLLEVGSARVTPFIARDMSSFVHDHLEREGQIAEYADNRPRGVRCVHPFVTLLEKLDALMKRLPREDVGPATFVRHFEDAAHIILAETRFSLPETYENTRALAEEMLEQKQIAVLPAVSHQAFEPNDGERWGSVRKAHAAIAPMFWGPRLSVEESCVEIRRWISAELG